MRELDAGVDLLALHRSAPEKYPFLLQSTARSTARGRYDILFAQTGESLVLQAPGVVTGRANGTRFLDELDRWWLAEQNESSRADLPFSGGWFLYLGYELAAEAEPGLVLPGDRVLPVAFAVRCHAAVVCDRKSGRIFAISESGSERFADTVTEDVRAIRDVDGDSPAPRFDAAGAAEEEGDRFLESVARARDYIAAGDIYQANLSRGWSASVDPCLTPDAIYASLCRSNPGPFAGLVRWNGASIISSSPERLLKIHGGVASTRPIAGTRPRSTDAPTDSKLSAELFAHPKERAEHVMLIDLERNDLGRICKPGTVEVDEMMVLESYAHVHHIVSNVRGLLRDGVTPGEAIAAVFPGGTITGCPKFRCMQIISELESAARGAYTGSFGYLNLDGSMDLNILIRTMVMRDAEITFRAGSGIVADSDPVSELEETRAKAKGMLRALSA